MAVDFDALTLGPCIASYGEPVLYSVQGNQPAISINGIFMDGWENLVVIDGPNETIDRPMLGVRLIDMQVQNVNPKQRDTIVIRGNPYIVREVRLDAVGHAKLMLNYTGA